MLSRRLSYCVCQTPVQRIGEQEEQVCLHVCMFVWNVCMFVLLRRSNEAYRTGNVGRSVGRSSKKLKQDIGDIVIFVD